MGGALSGLFLTKLIDSQATFFSPGIPVYYRTKNFNEIAAGESVSEMGFAVPAVSGGQTPGTTDTQIFPQPGIRMMTPKQLADSLAAGVTVRAGARVFNFSNSWVYGIMTANGWTNPRQVFNDPSVVGFFHDNLLFQIVSFVHNDMYGEIVNWDVICNGNEIQ